jgi:exopolyphosphatase/guanosine-5'-triphosphate,3'-diphosphate pyrophosphatase
VTRPARRACAIDIGTNTVLMLVAEQGTGGVVRAVVDRARVVRLGEAVDRTGRLATAAIERSLAVLSSYAEEAHALGVAPHAVGTQALREVGNAEAFLAPARAILGRDVEVVGGEREAELVWRAVRETFPKLEHPLVVDVGGGSTELVTNARRQSLPIGAVRLHERYLAHDPPTADEVHALEGAIKDALAGAQVPRGLPLVGVAGTVTTLAAMYGGIDPYDPELVHRSVLDRRAVAAEIDRLRRLTLAERRRLAGLDPARADVILAGALIVAPIMDAAGAGALSVSDHGVRWGLAYELLSG